MKYLLIIALLFFGGGLLLYLRLRPYLRAARELQAVLRAARRGATPPGRDETLPQRPAPNEVLTRCAACGTWTPAGNALKLGAQSYCSHDCLEKKSARRS